MYEDQTLSGRIDRLEQKIDRLFSDLFRLLSQFVTGDPKLLKRSAALAAPPAEAAGQQPGNGPYSPEGAGLKVLRLDVNDDGGFDYDPPRWNYRIGTRLQWVSKTGKFTVKPMLQQDFEGLESPFDRRSVINSKFDHEEGVWKSDPIEVNSVFSDAERLGRQLSGAPWAYYNYVVALEKSGEIMIDSSLNGTAC